MQGRHAKNTEDAPSFKDRARAAARRATSRRPSSPSFGEGLGRGRHGSDASSRGGGRRPKRQNIVTRTVNQWCNRLLGAVSEGSLDQEEEYASHRTTRDYICNTIGAGAWGMVFPLLTIVVTQLCGVEQAGMFSMAFIIGSLLMIVANYGARTYQVSDIDEKHSFVDYQINRVITCIAMLVIAAVYCNIRGYDSQMFTICMGVCVYKMVDGLADVYEGRLQQMDKLYLAGISQAFRSVVVLIVFSIAALITRDLGVASIAMGVAAVLSFVVLTFPLAWFETPSSHVWSPGSVAALFKQCFPVFLALFMYALIDNMPKFVMEGVLSYDNQLYFNALYFPAQAILLTVGSIYKPLLVRMAQMWADAEKRRRFDLVILAIVAVVVVITLVVIFIMGWIGIPIMSFMYGIDFEQFRGLSYIMIAAGGVTAIIDFLYQVITVLRRQKSVMKLYVITFGFSLFVPILLIDFTGLPGAVIGYLIVMTILLVLLVWEYASIRIDLARHPERVDAMMAGEEALGQDAAQSRDARRNASAPHNVTSQDRVPSQSFRRDEGAADRRVAQRPVAAERAAARGASPIEGAAGRGAVSAAGVVSTGAHARVDGAMRDEEGFIDVVAGVAGEPPVVGSQVGASGDGRMSRAAGLAEGDRRVGSDPHARRTDGSSRVHQVGEGGAARVRPVDPSRAASGRVRPVSTDRRAASRASRRNDPRTRR